MIQQMAIIQHMAIIQLVAMAKADKTHTKSYIILIG